MKIGQIPLLALLILAFLGCGEGGSTTGPVAPTPDEIVAANGDQNPADAATRITR